MVEFIKMLVKELTVPTPFLLRTTLTRTIKLHYYKNNVVVILVLVVLKRSHFKDMEVKFTIFLGSYCFRCIWSRFNSQSSDIKLIRHST